MKKKKENKKRLPDLTSQLHASMMAGDARYAKTVPIFEKEGWTRGGSRGGVFTNGEQGGERAASGWSACVCLRAAEHLLLAHSCATTIVART